MKKHLSILFLFPLTFVLLMLGTVYNLKEFANKAIEHDASVINDLVQIELKSQNNKNIKDMKEILNSDFINELSKINYIKKIWITDLLLENEKDFIDSEVISNKEFMIENYNRENIFNTNCRIAIPIFNNYNIPYADKHVKLILNIVLDNSNYMTNGLNTIYYLALLFVIITVLSLLFMFRNIFPNIDLLNNIKKLMADVHEGNYSVRLKDSQVYDQEVALWINELLIKLENTLNEIEDKMHDFLTLQKNKDKDPLIDIKNTINRMSMIYTFKKLVEEDTETKIIYKRLVEIIKEEYKVEHFSLVEYDSVKNTNMTIFLNEEEECNISKDCRAIRTKRNVTSDIYLNSCENFCPKIKTNYFCKAFPLTQTISLVLSIKTDNENKEKINYYKQALPEIYDYVNIAKSEIISRKLMEQLEMNASLDPLTGLFNRKYLEDSIDSIYAQSQRKNISYGILMIDIDNFKSVNDTYGHAIGDKALTTLSKVLKENLRKSDLLIRYGGEEFLVILYDCKQNAILEIAEKLRVNFSETKIQTNSESINRTISIGATSYPHNNHNLWEAIKDADKALYKAKQTGKNKVIYNLNDDVQ